MVSQCLNFLNEQFFSSPVHTETRISSWTLLFVVLLFKPQFMNYLVVKTQISIHGTTGPPNNELSKTLVTALYVHLPYMSRKCWFAQNQQDLKKITYTVSNA